VEKVVGGVDLVDEGPEEVADDVDLTGEGA
jgi:hypothetical protein